MSAASTASTASCIVSTTHVLDGANGGACAARATARPSIASCMPTMTPGGHGGDARPRTKRGGRSPTNSSSTKRESGTSGFSLAGAPTTRASWLPRWPSWPRCSQTEGAESVAEELPGASALRDAELRQPRHIVGLSVRRRAQPRRRPRGWTLRKRSAGRRQGASRRRRCRRGRAAALQQGGGDEAARLWPRRRRGQHASVPTGRRRKGRRSRRPGARRRRGLRAARPGRCRCGRLGPHRSGLVLHQQGARVDSLATHGVCEDKRLLKPGCGCAAAWRKSWTHRWARTRGLRIYWRLTRARCELRGFEPQSER